VHPVGTGAGGAWKGIDALQLESFREVGIDGDFRRPALPEQVDRDGRGGAEAQDPLVANGDGPRWG
jgi:hypothetical protein